MTDRINHEARAIEMLSSAPADLRADDAIAVAQVAATLALVEQQRIANLIALDMQQEQYLVPEDGETGEESYWSTRLRADVREALGL